MPRPPTKRSRLPSKAVPIHSKEKPQPEHDGFHTAHISRSPAIQEQDAGNASQSASKQANTSRQLRNQTPMSKAYEQAIESSPIGERGATGSRPPTRSRGYSSTISIAGRKGDLSSKIPGTPAFESSILSNFRRRPRQASILQMMQAEDGSSELDDDDFLGDLSPEDESTPLNFPRTKTLLVRNTVSPSPSQPSLPSSDGPRKRKQSTKEREVSQSPSAIVRNSLAEFPSPSDRGESGLFSKASSQYESVKRFNQIMAPPLSSSPSSTSLYLTSTTEPALSSEAPRKATKACSSSDTTTLPTATLQSRLLPRRQRQRGPNGATGFLSDSNDDGDSVADRDDDELSYPLSRRHGVKKKSSYRSLANKRHASSQGRSMERLLGAVESSNLGRGKINGIKELPPREDAVVDKENGLASTSSPLSSPLDSAEFESDSASDPASPADFLSEELRVQAKRFAEIDKWEMDFEDIPGSQGSAFD
ncbi:hypothetical protein BDV25DRAFT_152625 [Aspergillus avenaceus]|uniref:Uncharacterized protein n=1 Tax=Aspergillus avenaceus TaxID=36643 RepID=A0A5N6TZ12_ASPAV|nr:hypothetical protein BDV25DRAFT_152625 [Aspergillus avenaceus]